MNDSVKNHKAKTLLEGCRFLIATIGFILHKFSLKLLSFKLKESSIYFDKVDGKNIIKHKVFDEINDYSINDFVNSNNIYTLDKDQLINIIRYFVLNTPHDDYEIILTKSDTPDHFKIITNGKPVNSHWLEIISNKQILEQLSNEDYIVILNVMKNNLKANSNISPTLRVIK